MFERPSFGNSFNAVVSEGSLFIWKGIPDIFTRKIRTESSKSHSSTAVSQSKVLLVNFIFKEVSVILL